MSKRLRIGIVGCGAIGSSVAIAIKEGLHPQLVLSYLYDINYSKTQALIKKLRLPNKFICHCLEQLVEGSDIVVEATHAKASFNITKKTLAKGKDILVMSVGGILQHIKKLEQLAQKKSAHIYIPSGAIAGVDALKAARLGKIYSVTLTTIKPPTSFDSVEYIRDRKINLRKIKKDTIIFSGNAKEAIRLFPQNVNVAGVLSLAGVSQEKTKVKIIASPKAKNNIHEIRISSQAGEILTRTQNLLHPENPKTSFLAVLSAQEVLRQLASCIRVGT
ncbi:MAG: aspartate dehydrogenase [Candidatus Omnitrophica bacterium]|nr:aspartate dehydrogenase [Candidatus Omnitrophota bacterium]